MNICTKLRSAATRLCHLAAVAMHGAAASPLFVCHGRVRDTGEYRRSRYEQQQHRDEAEQTAHHLTICFRLTVYFGTARKGCDDSAVFNGPLAVTRGSDVAELGCKTV